MSYKIEDNCITETVDEVFDNQGRKYYLETNYIYDREYKSQEVETAKYRICLDLD